MAKGGLSGAVCQDGLVVLTAVVADPAGACDAVQVLVAERDLGAAVRAMRRAHYRRVGTQIGSMRIDTEDVEVAVQYPGVVFERVWLDGDSKWRRIEPRTDG